MEITKQEQESALQAIVNTLEMHQFFSKAKHEVFDHEFKGFGIHKSVVRVHIFTHEEINLVVIEDLGMGTSVTNAAEQLATEINKLKRFNLDKTAWLECYPYNGSGYPIDRITFEYNVNRNEFRRPEWTRVNAAIAERLRREIRN